MKPNEARDRTDGVVNSRVVKRLSPTQHGAIKLAERFGSRLVCVRYRHDPTGQRRYTTVELIVEEADVKPRTGSRAATPLHLVAIRVAPTESHLYQVLKARGAVWDGKARLWYISRQEAKRLSLLCRVV